MYYKYTFERNTKTMKIAIIGAGISGLSCALELKNSGINPTIFEKRSQVGEPAGYSSIWLRSLPGIVMDQFAYFRAKYNFDLAPLSYLKEIVMTSPIKTLNIRGKLGYIVKRGPEKNSLENQLAEKMDAQIQFDSYININEILNEYNFIVVANANNLIAKNFNLWTDTFVAPARVATVLGNFDTGSAQIWLNTSYAKNGFAYLVPNSQKEATLTLIVNGIASRELDYYWKKFLTTENINYCILETNDLEHTCGFMSSYKTDNVLFTGNAAGLTDDLIGCGGFNAVESGALAARSIIHNLDYNKLLEPVSNNIKKLHRLRKVFNTFDNNDIESFLSFIGAPGIKQFIYNNPLLKFKYASPIESLIRV